MPVSVQTVLVVQPEAAPVTMLVKKYCTGGVRSAAVVAVMATALVPLGAGATANVIGLGVGALVSRRTVNVLVAENTVAGVGVALSVTVA